MIPTVFGKITNWRWLEDSFSSFTPRLIIDYKPNDDTTWYFNAALGNKAAGFNTDMADMADSAIAAFEAEFGAGLSVPEEELINYELGWKGIFAGGQHRLNVAAYYLDWARENFRLNRLDDESRYQFLRADIVELLANPERFSLKSAYDLIFFDPPSFSNSSKMQQTLDIQRDHGFLLKQAMGMLAKNGLLLFSTNRRGFKLDAEIERAFHIRDISAATIPEDFKRNPKIHRCWEIRLRHA